MLFRTTYVAGLCVLSLVFFPSFFDTHALISQTPERRPFRESVQQNDFFWHIMAYCVILLLNQMQR